MSASPLDAVISHWSKLFEDFQTAPLPFYDSVETAIARRKIPEVTMERIEYKEGGLVSSRREYLRVKRGNHAFDICAAPFGSGFFFSTWLVEVPILKVAQKFAVYFILFVLFVFFTMNSLLYGPFVFLLLVFAALFVLSTSAAGFDDFVMELPGIGWLYARLFRPITFYRIDSALMFQAAVQAAVLESIDALTNAQGIRAMSELERKPILKAFAKSV